MHILRNESKIVTLVFPLETYKDTLLRLLKKFVEGILLNIILRTINSLRSDYIISFSKIYEMFFLYGESLRIWTCLVTALPTSSRSACFSRVSLHSFFPATVVPYPNSNTSPIRISVDSSISVYLAIHSLFPAYTDTCQHVLPYTVKTLLENIAYLPTEFSVPAHA